MLREATLKILPGRFAHQWIRNSLNLSIPLANSRLRFEIASNADDLKAALTLVQENFAREGYASRTQSTLRMTPYHLLPETMVIIAKDGEKIVATNTLIPRTPFGIPLDSCFPLDHFLEGKGKAVEISALAVDPSVRGQHGEILYNLMKYMYNCNVRILGVNTELIGVNPKMRPLYEAILLFKKIPTAKIVNYDFANGAPVVPMYFSLDQSHETFAEIYRGKPAGQNLMVFFLDLSPPQFAVPSFHELDELLPQRRPSELKQMLSWNPEMIRSLSDLQRHTLEDLYKPWPQCAQIIRKAINDNR